MEKHQNETAAAKVEAASQPHRPSFPPRPGGSQGGAAESTAGGSRGLTQWKTVLVLLVLVVATYLGFTEVWGMLFLYWVFRAITQKEAFLIEPIHWKYNPILFSIVTLLWFTASLYYLFFNGEQFTWLGGQLFSLFG